MRNFLNFGAFCPPKLLAFKVCPIFKKYNRTLAKNYRPVSLLPNASKVFERIPQTQLLSYMEKFISPVLCGYRKGYTQRALITLIEKMKESLDNNGLAAAVFNGFN